MSGLYTTAMVALDFMEQVCNNHMLGVQPSIAARQRIINLLGSASKLFYKVLLQFAQKKKAVHLPSWCSNMSK